MDFFASGLPIVTDGKPSSDTREFSIFMLKLFSNHFSEQNALKVTVHNKNIHWKIR